MSEHPIKWIIAGGNAPTTALCGEYRGKADQCPTRKEGHYYKRFRYNCKKTTCPNCYEKQIYKMAHFALERFNNIRRTYYMLGHVMRFGELILSPPDTEYHRFNDKQLLTEIRREAQQLAEACGMIGGMIVIHPYRGRLEYLDKIRRHTTEGTPNYHFHVIGFRLDTWEKSSDFYARTGWIYKWVDEYKQNGQLRNMYNKISYELNHAGIYTEGERFGMITTWYGITSRNGIKQLKTVTHDPVICLICKAQAHRYELDESIDLGPTENKKIHIDYTIEQRAIERARKRYKLAQGPRRYEDLTHQVQVVKT